MYFFKKFRIKVLGLRLGCMFKFRFKVYYKGLGLRIGFQV